MANTSFKLFTSIQADKNCLGQSKTLFFRKIEKRKKNSTNQN